MNFPMDPELHLRCHRWEQLQREAEIYRHSRSQLADPRASAPRRRLRRTQR